MRIFRREFLAHNVYRGNRCTLIISKDIQPGKVQALQKADNKHIVIDHSHNPKNVRIAAGLVGLLYLLLLFNSITIQWNLTLAFAHGMFLLALIILILLSIKTPIHQIVFDRTTGLVALPYGFRNN